MALRWRIRHKLLLGFALVITLVGLILAGTLIGLESYQANTRVVERKLDRLQAAYYLRNAIKELPERSAAVRNPGRDEYPALRAHFQEVNCKFQEYKDKLDVNILQGRTREELAIEKIQFDGLRSKLDTLKVAIDEANSTGGAVASTGLLIEKSRVKEALKETIDSADDLISTIYKSFYTRGDSVKREMEFSFYLLLGIGVGGLLILACLFRRFYCWVVHPIRDLKNGVDQVAQGDFARRIDIQSGDEMQDLAARFNHMTDQLQHLYNDLHRQVNERSRQLVRSERLASVGFLAAGVAHEINNPLASIAFCSEALDRRLEELFEQTGQGAERGQAAGKDRETIAKYLKMIQDEAFRCKKITQRLLEFSRGGERTREPVDLTDTIQSVLDVVQHLQNCRGKNLIFQPLGKLIAWVNGQEIKSVVLNLVVNALESMDEGGTLTITYRTLDLMAEMCFTDTGCGMDEEVLENLFEPFFTRSRTGKGTGLGLSISHRIINQHGGELEAFSAGPNRGSTFVVRLPLQARDTGHTDRSSEAPAEELEQPRRAA